MKSRIILWLVLSLFIIGFHQSCEKEEKNNTTHNNTPPVAAFTADSTSISVGQTVNFTDQSTNNPTSWQWNFGDGGTSTQQNPSHTYTSVGTFTVELLASNDFGSDKEVKSDFILLTTGPCPGTPTVKDADGNVYNTVLIGDQCWMAENLNVGTMIDGANEQQNNDTIEKYCYNNEPDSCAKYGGLYYWLEMMQYTIQEGTQGICPTGWHIPTDEEWKILEGTVDSQYGVGDSEWKIPQDRGYDAGRNLKAISGWYNGGNGTDLYGFKALPAGGGKYLIDHFHFGGIGYVGSFWASSMYWDLGWERTLEDDKNTVHRFWAHFDSGNSVRCIRDEPYTSRQGGENK